MIAFPSMLISAAKAANMAHPKLDKTDNWDFEKFPHFTVFAHLQLNRPMQMNGEQFRNAVLIANIPLDRLKTMTLENFLAEGLEYAQ